MKLQEVFTISEKRTFVETLLIIAGVMTGFNPSPLKTTFFVTFALSSIYYIIWISKIKHQIKNKRFTSGQSFNNWIISFSVGIFFSALVIIVGIPAGLSSITSGELSKITIVIWVLLYFLLTVLLTLVLGLRNFKTKSLKK